MLKRSLKHLSWWSLMLAMLLGLVLLGLRLGLPRVADYRTEIADWLGAKLHMELQIGQLDAGWSGYYPTLNAGDLQLQMQSEQGPHLALKINRLELQLAPWRSLLHWQPIFKQLHLQGVNAHWRQQDGHWLPPVEAAQEHDRRPLASASGWQQLLALALSQPELRLSDSTLVLEPEQGVTRTLEGINARLENLDKEHQFSGELSLDELGEGTRLSFAVQFEGIPQDPLQGDFPFYLKLDSLGPELFQLADVTLPLSRLRAGTELWGHWRQGELASLQGRLAVAELAYGQAERQLRLSNSHLDFALLPRAQGYQLQLKDIVLNSGDSRLALEQLLLEGDWSQGRLQPERLALPQLALAPLSQWLVQQAMLPEAARKALEALSPRGELHNLTLDWPQEGSWQDARMRADAHELGVDAYYGAPRIRGASGLIEAGLRDGTLHLVSDRFAMHFPKLYSEGWQFSQADGRIQWQLRPDAALISSQLLHLSDDTVSAAGRFSIEIPYQHDQQTELTLMIGMRDSDGRQAQRFTPPREVGEQLHHWLGEAIEGGRVRQAGFLLHGGTRRLEPRVWPSVELFFDVGQAQLNYDSQWPLVSDADLFLYVRDGDLRVDLRQGRVMDSQIRGGWAYKALHEPNLQVVSVLRGPAADVSALLRSEPLNQSVGQALDDWQLSGQLETRLDLSIPLQGQDRTPGVQVDAQLQDGRLQSERLGLRIDALSGPLSYHSDSGLAGGPLRGQLLDHQVQGVINTEQNLTRVSLSGKAPVTALQDWLQLDALAPVSGELPYEAQLLLCNRRQNCQNRFELHSNLVGTAVDLPAPFGLSKAEQGALSVQLGLDSRQLDFNYGDRLKGRFDLAAATPRGTLHLGAGEAQLRAGDGIQVDGRLTQLRVSDLATLKSRFMAVDEQSEAGTADGAAAPVQLRRLGLEIDELQTGSVRTGPLHLVLEPAAQGWFLRLSGEGAAGEIRVPELAGQPIAVSLSRLALQKTAAAETDDQAAGTDSEAEWMDVSSLPPIDLSIQHLLWDGRELGHWQAQLRVDADRLRIGNIEAIMNQLVWRGELNWLQGRESHTDLRFKVQGEDIGEQLERWRLQRALESQSLEADLQLQWPGAPWQLKMAGLDGRVEFKLKTGRLIESGSSANLLRVFGLLNFNTLGRRLRLDFTDLFKKGVVFDRLAGEFQIDKGIASTLTPLQMEGPSADLQARGSLNLIDETVDQEMQVTLPLTSNVPFAAVLLGAPQVAGAVFLIDKLIGDKLERVTTLSYRVSGDWSEPQIELLTRPP